MAYPGPKHCARPARTSLGQPQKAMCAWKDNRRYAVRNLGGNLISATPPAPGPDDVASTAKRASRTPPATATTATTGSPVGVEPGDIDPDAPTKKPRPSRKVIGVIVLLSVALAAVIGTLAYYLIQLSEANDLIDEQQQQLEEQGDLLDRKETFGAAMETLLSTAQEFDGVLMASIVPTETYERMARQAWVHRWDATAVDRDIENVVEATAELEDLLAAASIEASTNVTGTVFETATDQLGVGFVASLLDDADTFCGDDVLACVSSEDPYIVHFDAADNTVPYMTDFLRTGIAYHEFAHVLQITNPVVTKTALDAFGGDDENMADCFALTYLDGWKLHHRVWVSSYQYWEVDIGYGYTCNEPQKQVIRDWYGQLGYTTAPISQS